MKIALVFASWFQPEWRRCVESWNHSFYLVHRMNILDAYQKAFEDVAGVDVIGYLHDDLICHESGWKQRILNEFAKPDVAVVGFAGGYGHGHPEMRSIPFKLEAMGRVGFRSNMIDAEKHGARFTGACNAVILDGMAIFVRRSFLAHIGGWPLNTPIGYFQYCEWLCCMARRHRKRIRVVGVSVEHLGGKSTGVNPDLKVDIEAEHRWMWEEFTDVLPMEVEP